MSFDTSKNKINKLWNIVYDQSSELDNFQRYYIQWLPVTTVKHLHTLSLELIKNPKRNDNSYEYYRMVELIFEGFPKWALTNSKVLLTWTNYSENDSITWSVNNRFTYNWYYDENTKTVILRCFLNYYIPQELDIRPNLNLYFYNEHEYHEIPNNKN